jgi:amino acid adenylation domain-containing protein
MQAYPIVSRLLDLPSDWREREVFRSTAGSLNFSELREGMLRFAGWLINEAGARSGDRVAICLPKSLEAVQVIYGILAIGATYVPIAIQEPVSRLMSILGSARPHVLLTTPEIANRLQSGAGMHVPPLRLIRIANNGLGLASLLAATAPIEGCASVQPDDLAVILFTSGSTGEPKGVMLSHRYLEATAAWARQRQGMTEAEILISNSGLHYLTSLDIFFPLLSGYRVFLLSDWEAMLPDFVTKVIESEGVTVWSSTATAIRLLLEQGELEKRNLGALRLVEFYGERLSVAVLRRLLEALPRAVFVNMYGATEAYVIFNFVVPRPLPEEMEALPLGLPVGGFIVTILDERGKEARPGEVGEICVSGPRTLSGYWDNPELTEAKRIDGVAGSYRTGDLGFIGADGMFHLVGRRDSMIKLRGHRFDLGEIEAALKLHPGVRDAVAFSLAPADGEPEIRAAVLAQSGNDLLSELRRLCFRRLPAFARPVSVTQLEQFPLLSTGKIDRQALKALISIGTKGAGR